jgi:hypothetical protein
MNPPNNQPTYTKISDTKFGVSGNIIIAPETRQAPSQGAPSSPCAPPQHPPTPQR